MYVPNTIAGGKIAFRRTSVKRDEESEDRYNWLVLARGRFPLPRMAAFMFATNKPRCLF